MENKTRIIMTEVKSPHGRYVDFMVKGTGEHVAEVDRRNGKYAVFSIRGGIMDWVAEEWQKSRAINRAQKEILGFIPNAEFKWNVMTKRIRFA